MGTSTGTIMTLANSIIGVSVLAMPFCFKQCGIVLSIVMLIASSLLSRLACYLLLKSAVMARRRTFEFLAFHTFGSTGKFAVELFIIGFLMGTCIAFFVVMGDLGPAIVAKILGVTNTAALRPSVLIGLAIFVVLPLGMLRNVDSLSSVSMATIGFYICFVVKVFGEAVPHLLAGDWYEHVHFWRPAGILQCIPIFSMALFCQTQLFEIYDSMHNASLDRMNFVIRAACNICTGVYICVGFFGYIAFCTQSFTGNVLMSLTPSAVSEMIKLGFVLSVAVSFPLVIFPCRASLYSLLFRRVGVPHHEAVGSHIPEARFKCLTVFIVSAALLAGLLVPSIELVLGLVGSTIGVLICVMFPAAAFICMSAKHSSDRLLAQVLLFVGALILVLGTYATLYAAHDAKADVENITGHPLPGKGDRPHFPGPHIAVDSVSDPSQGKLKEAEANAEPPELKDKPKPQEEKPQADRRQEPPVPMPVVERLPEQPARAADQQKQLAAAEGRQEVPVPVADRRQKPPGPLPVAERQPEPLVPVPVVEMRQEPVALVPEKHQAPPEERQKPLPVVDARQEPPVPVEPAGKLPAAPGSVAPPDVQELAEKMKPALAAPREPQVAKPKEIIPDIEKKETARNIEQVDQDAIKKEEEELAEAERGEKVIADRKNEELLRKLEKHDAQQKQIMQEQKLILQALQEHSELERIREERKRERETERVAAPDLLQRIANGQAAGPAVAAQPQEQRTAGAGARAGLGTRSKVDAGAGAGAAAQARAQAGPEVTPEAKVEPRGEAGVVDRAGAEAAPETGARAGAAADTRPKAAAGAGGAGDAAGAKAEAGASARLMDRLRSPPIPLAVQQQGPEQGLAVQREILQETAPQGNSSPHIWQNRDREKRDLEAENVNPSLQTLLVPESKAKDEKPIGNAEQNCPITEKSPRENELPVNVYSEALVAVKASGDSSFNDTASANPAPAPVIINVERLSDPDVPSDSPETVAAMKQAGHLAASDAKPMKRDLKSLPVQEEKTDKEQRRSS